MKIDSGNAFRPRVIGLAAFYLGLGALVFFLAFCNLDGRLFWGDEAETALLGKDILKFGVPKVDDGRVHISLHGDSIDARNGVWTWSPWLPDYLTAASFAVFGPTTWAGRAPFAFTGWLAVILLGVVAWKVYRSHRIALAGMLLMGTSEVFLLHIRQCRYYSATVLAEEVLVYGMFELMAQKKRGSWLILGGLLVQFYCNYTSALANIPVLAFLAWRLFRQKSGALPSFLLSVGIWILFSIPWLLYAETWRQGAAEMRETPLHLLHFYAWQFHFHFFPWCFLLLPAGGWFFKRSSRNTATTENPQAAVLSFEKYLMLLMLLYVPVLAVMPLAFSRYLLPLLPVVSLLVAAWIFRYIRWTIPATAVLAVQCLTNVFAVATDPFAKQYPLRSPFADVVFSAMLPYGDRLTDALHFFKEQARPGDILVSWDPEFPLAFYTGLKVVDARLTADPFHPLPHWILPESVTGDLNQRHDELPESLKGHYERIALTVHDSPQVDNIPEPEAYQLQSAKAFAPFVIYKLKE